MEQQTSGADERTIRPTDLATALECSVAYASQLLSGARTPNAGTAIKIFDKTGLKLGAIKEANDAEIETLRKFAEAA